ncbi:MAG: HEAT repeat domain-containing protein [Planctomycetes bacterium]|nr:HEAT repeat domain-containing protein [Planctomycetota bacterium]
MTVQSTDLATHVKQALDAVRAGDLGPVSDLQSVTEDLTPLLAPYLRDRNEDVRREVVLLIAMEGGPAALPLLTRALADPNPEIQERAALALYEQYEPSQLATEPALGEALAASVTAENPSAAAALLLAYFPGPEAEQTLRAERDRTPPSAVKLFSWSAPVNSALPARVALTRLGDAVSQRSLIQAIPQSTPAEVEFLLAALREIQSPALVRALAVTLDDPRKAVNISHSGARLLQRLCDVAVNAFVHRFDLEVSFDLSPKLPYSPNQIDEVRRLLKSELPK